MPESPIHPDRPADNRAYFAGERPPTKPVEAQVEPDEEAVQLVLSLVDGVESARAGSMSDAEKPKTRQRKKS